MPRLLTEPEAAQRLRFSTRMMRSLRARGELSYIKIGRKVLYEERELVDFVERHRVLERSTS